MVCFNVEFIQMIRFDLVKQTDTGNLIDLSPVSPSTNQNTTSAVNQHTAHTPPPHTNSEKYFTSV